MTEDELRRIISDGESDRVEFTTATGDTEIFAEAVCAFANDLPNHGTPGYLLIGVNDSKAIAGAIVDDRLLQRLGELRASGAILPLPSIVVEKVATSLGDVAAVTVRPSQLPPVRYKGRVCIRIGPRRGYATEQEERTLSERRVSHALTFDAQPCLGATLDDLSRTLFLVDYLPQVIAPDVIAQNNRSLPEQLASLRFYDLGNNCPTNAGILLFGMDVRHWLPGAYVQFLVVDGPSLSDRILNEREIQGDLRTLLSELDALVDAQLTRTPAADSLLHERTVESYPRSAIRELLLNGVMHRDYAANSPLRLTWYSDRVEIQSIGGLYGEASAQNFPRQTSYRNPIVAKVMKSLGYVNRFGRGIISAQGALAKNESPPAEFAFDAGYFLATVRRRP